MLRSRAARRLVVSGAGLLLGGALGLELAAARPRPLRARVAPPAPPPGLPPARIVDVPGVGELFVREAAGPTPDAPVVVLLHGWMFPSDLNWHPAYEPLSKVARVIAVDHRGHGRGTRPSEPFRLADVADDVAALLRTLDAAPAIAVGYSMGGPVAQLLWQRHPQAVRGLVLCATSGTFNDDARDRMVWRGMGLLQVLLRLVPRHWYEALLERQLSGRPTIPVTRMITPDTPPEVADRLPWVLGELSRGSAEDLAEAGRELSRFDARGWLGTVDVPTVVIATTRDRLVPIHRQRDLAASIPGAVLEELPLDHDAAMSAGTFVPALVKAVVRVADPPASAG